MLNALSPGHPRRLLFFDVTFLRFGGDLRGIPQVIFSLVGILSEPVFAGRIKFLAYADVAEKYLLPRGIPASDIQLVSDVPLLGRFERFHGLFSTWRYRSVKKDAAAIFHAEARSITRMTVPQIVLWYDFIQLGEKWGSWKKPTRQLFLRYKYHWAAKAIESVTISAHIKNEALRRFPEMDPRRIFPVLLGFRGAFRPEIAPDGPLDIPLRCAYVGSFEPRKNVFEMLARLGDIFGSLPFELHLVGRISDADLERAQEILTRNPHVGKVIFHGLLSDAELDALMRSCRITLFPSLAEGFGLPVVEAMARGHAVFAFANTSIPEVAGGAAVLAADNDFAGWGVELQRLARDMQALTALRARALERAEFFSETNMKQRYREYFQGLLTRSGVT